MSEAPAPDRGTSRRLVIILGIAAVVTVGAVAVMLGAFSGGMSGTGSTATSPAGATTPPPVAIGDEVVADGIAMPIRTAELAVGTGGTVSGVAVALGDAVAAGDPLVTLDTAAIDAEIAGARATVDAASARSAQAAAGKKQADEQVAVAEANLDGAQAALETARDNNTREDEATAARNAARAQVRVARAAATGAAEAVTAAEADVRRAEAAVASLELARDDLSVRAPFPGTVASLAVREGELVSPGQVLVRIADESAWEFVATELDESGIAGVRVGAPATVTLDGVPGTSIAGTVARMGAYGQSRQGGIVYEVVVVPTGEVPDGVRWNMTVTVAIKVGG
jgi:multidrug resistance efflux pump